MCSPFFRKCLGKNLRDLLQFLKKTKNIKKPIQGALRSKIKKRKLILNVHKKFELRKCPPFFLKVPRGKVKRHFLVNQIILNLYLTGSRLSYQTCISNQDKLGFKRDRPQNGETFRPIFFVFTSFGFFWGYYYYTS